MELGAIHSSVESAMADTPTQIQLRSTEHLSMEQVRAAWLAAGAKGDAQAMKRLRSQHPQWLGLEMNRFCSWEYFHLPTIGASALLTAAWDGSAEIIEQLLDAGQDPDTNDNGGMTAMMVAILRSTSWLCAASSAMEKRSVELGRRQEESQLLQRILAVLELLLRFGANVNARNQEGYSALHYAGNGDALDVAKYLLDNEAHIDAHDQEPVNSILTALTGYGDSPAHYAARYGTIREMETLLHRLVALFGDLQTLEVENNPLNATNSEESTCLYLAGMSCVNTSRHREERDAIAQLLLQHGARLFHHDTIMIRSRSGSSEQIILHEQVRRAMAAWVRELSDDGDEARTSNTLLTEFCVEW
ncbi:Ankyrin repeat-containing domain [Phytophthora cactorum]|nr:Ankyrin repeat-containing domain [Phytophthora cactorum]